MFDAFCLPQYDDATYLAFANPLGQPLHHVGLEVVFTGCVVLTLRHVLREYRRGERFHLFQWLVIVTYGIAMELIAFNVYKNYEHGQFTVELYHRKLPLYITFVYVVLHYTGLKVVERWRLGKVAEALLAGFVICLIDVPFDIAGIDARWWTWAASDHDIAVRWFGVPVTSYYWYLLFGAILAWLCRAVRPRIESRPLGIHLATAPLVALAVIAVGIVAFLPFHALEALGVPGGVIVGAHGALCLALAARVCRGPAKRAPREIIAIPVVLVAWCLSVLCLLWAEGRVSHGVAKLGVIACAAAKVFAMAAGLPGRYVPGPRSALFRRRVRSAPG